MPSVRCNDETGASSSRHRLILTHQDPEHREMDIVPVKLTFDGDVRRFNVPSNISWSKFEAKVPRYVYTNGASS